MDLFAVLGTVDTVVPAVGWVLASLRHGDTGVEVNALLALGGTLAVREYLADALIALMPPPGVPSSLPRSDGPPTTGAPCWSALARRAPAHRHGRAGRAVGRGPGR